MNKNLFQKKQVVIVSAFKTSCQRADVKMFNSIHLICIDDTDSVKIYFGEKKQVFMRYSDGGDTLPF